MERRRFIRQTGVLGAGGLLLPHFLRAAAFDFPVVRTPASQRRFTSEAIESVIRSMGQKLHDPELAWLFNNCFPNTLDTTVDFTMKDGVPDTYVITGDIDAMWLRDSSAQVWPYLPFMKQDPRLQQMIQGVIRRQARCILLDPYANAFYKDPSRISEWKDDLTNMKPGIHERKWEIDSLCYPIRLAHGYWRHTGDVSVFDESWRSAMGRVLQTFREQQRFDNDGPYHFQRRTIWATDVPPGGGYGAPTKKVGLIHSMFRPSDDATVFPFLIPSNIFAIVSLQQLLEIIMTIDPKQKSMSDVYNNGLVLLDQLIGAVGQYGVVTHPQFGKVLAYEVDGFGNTLLMDDANAPGLLSLSYLVGDTQLKFAGVPFKTLYENTRQLVWSEHNPYFYKGRVAEGIGGPHVGKNYIWPMSIIMRALTSHDRNEVARCLDWLKASHAGTGFMHESFYKDDASKFTRKWFAWANTLLGELLLKIYG